MADYNALDPLLLTPYPCGVINDDTVTNQKHSHPHCCTFHMVWLTAATNLGLRTYDVNVLPVIVFYTRDKTVTEAVIYHWLKKTNIIFGFEQELI